MSHSAESSQLREIIVGGTEHQASQTEKDIEKMGRRRLKNIFKG